MWSAPSFQTLFWGLIDLDLIQFCTAVIRGLDLGARLLLYVLWQGTPAGFQINSEAQVWPDFASKCEQILLMVTTRGVPSYRAKLFLQHDMLKFV
jgi:hypothetical protein